MSEFVQEALLVVDMQAMKGQYGIEGFKGAYNERTVQGCLILIQDAMLKGLPIVFLEYTHFCCTHHKLMEAVEDYHSVAFVKKSRDNGGNEFHEINTERGWNARHIKVCGVNIGACVAATVHGLDRMGKGYKMQVVRQACNNASTEDPDHATFDQIKKHFSSIDTTRPTIHLTDIEAVA